MDIQPTQTPVVVKTLQEVAKTETVPAVQPKPVSTAVPAVKKNGKVLPDADKPAPPKRPTSGFFMYKQSRQRILMEQHKNLKTAEITKIISKEWNETVTGATK